MCHHGIHCGILIISRPLLFETHHEGFKRICKVWTISCSAGLFGVEFEGKRGTIIDGVTACTNYIIV
jgi:hypothetical protein